MACRGQDRERRERGRGVGPWERGGRGRRRGMREKWVKNRERAKRTGSIRHLVKGSDTNLEFFLKGERK